MSDKFFYKGRQDARQHHTAYGGFKTRASEKSGSRKFPLKLTVTSEDRRQLIAAQVAEAGLHAEITLDTRDDAVESIAELTVILNKTETVRQTRGPSRNDPCQCGSGKKFKKCCG